MITLPKDFTAIKYPGYFWNLKDGKLYSCKSGVLKPLAISNGYHGYVNGKQIDVSMGYYVSHQGIRRRVTLGYLNKLKLKDSTFPIRKR